MNDVNNIVYEHTNPLKNEPVSRKALAYEPNKVDRPHHGFKRFALILLMPFFIITSYKVKADLSRGKIQIPHPAYKPPKKRTRVAECCRDEPRKLHRADPVSSEFAFDFGNIFLSIVLCYQINYIFAKRQNPTVRKNRTIHRPVLFIRRVSHCGV